MLEQDRFWAKVQKTETCWLWTGALRDGYGRFALDGQVKWVQAHRYVLGEVPNDLEVDHLCRVRACVRPNHLEIVTKKLNIQRIPSYVRPNAEKTHCPYGHVYDQQNTRISRAGTRACRACDRERKRIAA